MAFLYFRQPDPSSSDVSAGRSDMAKKRKLLSLNDSDEELPEVAVQHRDVLNRYRIQMPADEDADPLHWWASHAGAFPSIALLARRYLATPATSVPCERLFSKAGNIVDKKRSAMTPDNVCKRVCLMDWLH